MGRCVMFNNCSFVGFGLDRTAINTAHTFHPPGSVKTEPYIIVSDPWRNTPKNHFFSLSSSMRKGGRGFVDFITNNYLKI